MQAYEAAAEKRAKRERLAPTVVVGITDDEPGKDEEEVDGKVTVVGEVDDGLVASELVALKHVIPHHKQRRYPTQPVEKGVVGLGISVTHPYFTITSSTNSQPLRGERLAWMWRKRVVCFLLNV